MNELINKCVNLVKESGFPFNICGGYALELFLNRTIRSHSDLDVCIYEEDKEEFIKFLLDKGWIIYEPQKNGLIRLISSPYEQKVEQICVYCLQQDCSLIKMIPAENDLYRLEILNSEQLNFDFIEVLFNPKRDGKFIYAQNHAITRDIEKAVLHNEKGIPYMSPELVLFCKSIYISRDGYQKDFDMIVPFLSDESKSWLIKSLKTLYPDGHKWLELLQTAPAV